MNNKTLVVIDAGHGGIDSGAVGNGLEEKDLNLKAAKHIYERLQELNIPVVITRTEDEYLPKDKRIERIKTLTNNNPNTLLRFHRFRDHFVICLNRDTLPLFRFLFRLLIRQYHFLYLHLRHHFYYMKLKPQKT